MQHVFISYIHEDAAPVQRLCTALTTHGIEVWLDKDAIHPGERWQLAIRKAIDHGTFFIACFSSNYTARRQTFMNEELVLAIERLRLMPMHRTWFIPVKLTECEIPDQRIGAGETLQALQWVALHTDWDEGVRRIIQAIQSGGSENHAVPILSTHSPSKDMDTYELETSTIEGRNVDLINQQSGIDQSGSDGRPGLMRIKARDIRASENVVITNVKKDRH